ncbi:XRE family transcriptional regulator [Streptomyces sp. NBC_01317]|uniref:XRE family transcriptional regulator n=1 Tax=Streptomyces sp. NBC_01317 TaxID=2903822 RepID=UPI002E168454|nr:XRE family transcriptional regulator [Streptomyces sp. NBC_01317]
MIARSPASRAATGAVAGFVFRLARESIPRTQAQLAEELTADLATVQGWESGRRPLANVKAGTLSDLRRRLAALGAAASVLRLLDAAMDADRLIGTALDPPGPVREHPLAGWVHTRDTAHMIAWAVNGTTPPALANCPVPPRRGPVAKAPLLGSQERDAFFTHLWEVAESAGGSGEGGALLHRQALYLTSYDRSPEASGWRAQALHARRDVLAVRGWTPRWAEARSTTTALARLGDPQPLLDFIERSMADDDTAETANLNYWAYWLGVSPLPQANDGFMRSRVPPGWEPPSLLRSLVEGLHQAPGYVDLYVHSLWALVTAHKWLPLVSPDLAVRLCEQTGALLDGCRISPRSRRELSEVHYVLRDHRR